jgi:hypothetical protein
MVDARDWQKNEGRKMGGGMPNIELPPTPDN